MAPLQLVPRGRGAESVRCPRPRSHRHGRLAEARHRRHRVSTGRRQGVLTPVYDMHDCEIVVWGLSRHPNLAQQKRLLRRLASVMPEGCASVQSMSRKATASTTRSPQGRAMAWTTHDLPPVQTRDDDLRQSLEQPMMPEKILRPYPGRIPEHDPERLGRYHNKQHLTFGVRFGAHASPL